MKFYFPDSHDLVDPSFDFATEKRSLQRVRQQHDQYAHEVFDAPPYDGLLISKAIVDGTEKGAGKYTTAQRQRLLRVGAREFFRIENRPLQTMGDCGAFAYVREPRPPYSVDEVVDFYEHCQVDFGVSVDHIILAFVPDAQADTLDADALAGHQERQEITLELAAEFWKCRRRRKSAFTPIGVAQGWSPRSYQASVRALQKVGYRYVGVGGLVPLKTDEILDVLRAVATVRRPDVALHLFGVSRCDHLPAFAELGVTSFDSTSPLLHAFKHDHENYWTPAARYSAIRVPQCQGNPKLAALIQAGRVEQDVARRLERTCLAALQDLDRAAGRPQRVLQLLREYDLLHDGRRDRTDDYRRTLEDAPWRTCPCAVCRQLGIHVVIFRGAERNRRRGFHNLHVTYRQVQAFRE